MNNQEFQKKHFEEYDYESGYDWSKDRRIPVVLRLLPKVSASQNLTLLDIGCNCGKTSEYFRAKGYAVSGIDISRKAVMQANTKGFKFIVGDITKGLPFPNDSFDNAFIGEVLEHILDPRALLVEAYRVLKKGGRLYITVPNICSLRNIFLMLFGRLPAYSSGFDSLHCKDFCQRDMRRLLQSAGFRAITFKGDCMSIPITNRLSINLPPIITRFSEFLIVKCMK